MRILGITGSIGMGKSTTLDLLSRRSIPVLSSDHIVRQLLQEDVTVHERIREAFPVLAQEKILSTRKLSMLIEGNHSALSKLESILHPKVFEMFSRFKAHWMRQNRSLIAFEIPLLFETHCEQWLDVVAVVQAPYFLQEQRVLRRPMMTREKFEFLLSRQLPLHVKRQRADFVLSSGIGKPFMAQQIDSMLKALLDQNRKRNNVT